MEKESFKIKAKYFNNDNILLYRVEEKEDLLEKKEKNKILENFNDKFEIKDIIYNNASIPYYKLYSPKLKGNIIINAAEMLEIMQKTVINKTKIKDPLYPIPKIDKYGNFKETYEFLTKKEFYQFLKQVNKEKNKQKITQEVLKNNKEELKNKNDIKSVKIPKTLDFYITKEGDIVLFIDKIKNEEYLTINMNFLFLKEQGIQFNQLKDRLINFTNELNKISEFVIDYRYNNEKINFLKQNLVTLFEVLLEGMIKKEKIKPYFQITNQLLEIKDIKQLNQLWKNELKFEQTILNEGRPTEPYFILPSDIRDNIDKIIKQLEKETKEKWTQDLDDYIDNKIIHKDFAKRQKEELQQDQENRLSNN